MRRRVRRTAWARVSSWVGADVQAGVVEDEIVEMDELAFQPQGGSGV